MVINEDKLSQILENQAIHGEKLSVIEDRTKGIEVHLIGNGKPGLLVRTDRLERSEKLKNLILWSALVVVGGLVIEAVGAFIGKW